MASPSIGSIWRHRTGKAYVVLGHCIIENINADGVLYRRANSDDYTTVWCRPADEFMDGRFTQVII